MSLDFQVNNTILSIVEDSLNKLGASATFCGEGMFMRLVRSRIDPKLLNFVNTPPTEIFPEKKIYLSEWIDEYLREELPDSYSIGCSSGGIFDIVTIHAYPNSKPEWCFKVLHNRVLPKPTSLPMLSQVWYKDGKVSMSKTLHEIMIGKKSVLRCKQSDDVFSLYSSVINFSDDPDGFSFNLRAAPGIEVKPKKTTNKTKPKPSNSYDDFFEIHPSIPVTHYYTGTNITASVHVPPQVWATPEPVPAPPPQDDSDLSLDGTW